MDAPEIQITEQGLFLPRRFVSKLGEIDIILNEDYILIKPKNMTARFKGFVHPRVSVQELHQDYELSLLQGDAT